MALHHETGGSNTSSTWGEAAAVQLLHLKHQQPSRTECHAASELLHIILQSTGDSSHPSLASRRRPALLGATDDATPLTEENSMMPFKEDATSNYDLPMPLADSRDDRYLSPLQCYIRKHCVEYFAATASNAGTKGRQTPISEGRVGVRCVFCKHLFRDQQAAQASESLVLLKRLPITIHILCSFSATLSFLWFFHSSLLSEQARVHLLVRRDAAVSSFSQLQRDSQFGTREFGRVEDGREVGR